MAGLAFVIVVVAIFLVAAVCMIALFVGLFFLIFRANTNRHQVVVDDALEKWAEEKGYEIISSEQVNRKADHPFRDRFGFGVRERGDYGGVVLWIVVEDRKGRERAGWILMPLKGTGGIQLGGFAVYADWQNAEVIWDQE